MCLARKHKSDDRDCRNDRKKKTELRNRRKNTHTKRNENVAEKTENLDETIAATVVRRSAWHTGLTSSDAVSAAEDPSNVVGGVEGACVVPARPHTGTAICAHGLPTVTVKHLTAVAIENRGPVVRSVGRTARMRRGSEVMDQDLFSILNITTIL